MSHRLFLEPANWRLLVAGAAISFVFAWVAAQLTRSTLRALLRAVLREPVNLNSPSIRGPLRLVGYVIFLLVFALLLVPALEVVGLRPRAGVHLRTLASWAFDSGLRILLITAFAYALIRMVGVSVTRFEHEVSTGTDLDALERAKRARTLGAVITSVTTGIVLVIAILMILREFRIDISPAVTGAGVVGVALGFGAQTLVKDLIGGFFLILENQMRVGDVVTINGTGGLVEAINLRTTVLRDYDGSVYIIPNGSIATLANRTKDFSYAVLDVPIAYTQDPDAVMDLLRSVGDELQHDDRFRSFILAPIEIAGIERFGDSAIIIRSRLKTMPLKQWDVGRELRRRIKKAFDANGIEIPFPQQVVHVAGDQDLPRRG